MASSSHLKPGEKGRLTAGLDTANRKGALVKTLEVFSNDPERQRVILILRADIEESKRPAIQP